MPWTRVSPVMLRDRFPKRLQKRTIQICAPIPKLRRPLLTIDASESYRWPRKRSSALGVRLRRQNRLRRPLLAWGDASNRNDKVQQKDGRCHPLPVGSARISNSDGASSRQRRRCVRRQVAGSVRETLARLDGHLRGHSCAIERPPSSGESREFLCRSVLFTSRLDNDANERTGGFKGRLHNRPMSRRRTTDDARFDGRICHMKINRNVYRSRCCGDDGAATSAEPVPRGRWRAISNSPQTHGMLGARLIAAIAAHDGDRLKQNTLVRHPTGCDLVRLRLFAAIVGFITIIINIVIRVISFI